MLDELVTLRGVGRKTASVVLAEAWAIPAIAVDTHVKRVSRRVGLTIEVDPVKIERRLDGSLSRRVVGGYLDAGHPVWPRCVRRPPPPLLGMHPGRPVPLSGKDACAGRRVMGAFRRSRFDCEIFKLGIPAFGALAADPLVSLVDTAFVGRLGASELGSLAVAAAVFGVAFALFNFLAYGTTPLVAAAMGRKDQSEAGRLASAAVGIGLRGRAAWRPSADSARRKCGPDHGSVG